MITSLRKIENGKIKFMEREKLQLYIFICVTLFKNTNMVYAPTKISLFTLNKILRLKLKVHDHNLI